MQAADQSKDRRTVLEEKFKIAVRTAKQQGTGNALDI